MNRVSKTEKKVEKHSTNEKKKDKYYMQQRELIKRTALNITTY